MNHVSTPYLAIAPCDNPLLPADLVMRLCEPLRANPELDISYAHDGQRPQFLFAVLRTDCLADVSEYLDHEQRSVGFWMQQHKCQQVDFSDRREQLLNFNELEAIAK
jgi:molybdopterin-guanine dinucleotide biosynthesis protein A